MKVLEENVGKVCVILEWEFLSKYNTKNRNVKRKDSTTCTKNSHVKIFQRKKVKTWLRNWGKYLH